MKATTAVDLTLVVLLALIAAKIAQALAGGISP